MQSFGKLSLNALRSHIQQVAAKGATYSRYSITHYYWTIGTLNRGGTRARCVIVIVDGDTEDTAPRLMRHFDG